jgi:hypothetical protein
MKTRKRFLRITGFVILITSCFLFILIPVVPWFGFPAGKVAGIAAGLLIAGEILFYLSLFILGKEFYSKIKSKIKFWKPETDSANLPAEKP